MRRHHLLMLTPAVITAAFVGWITAAPGSVPALVLSVPALVLVAMLLLGSSAFATALLRYRRQVRRRTARGRSPLGL